MQESVSPCLLAQACRLQKVFQNIPLNVLIMLYSLTQQIKQFQQLQRFYESTTTTKKLPLFLRVLGVSWTPILHYTYHTFTPHNIKLWGLLDPQAHILINNLSIWGERECVANLIIIASRPGYKVQSYNKVTHCLVFLKDPRGPKLIITAHTEVFWENALKALYKVS